MGSFLHNKAGKGGQPPGKIDASLDEKLRGVKWGEYKLGDLFVIEKTPSFNADLLTAGNTYDYVTRTSLNQGIFQTTGFVNGFNVNSPKTWSLGLLQMDFFYRTRPWYAGQFVRKITPKIEIPNGTIPFLTTILNKQKPKLLSVLVRNVDTTFRNIKVKLPINNDKQIDFEFIESFIAELEARRVAELDAYLTVTGLKDCTLTKEEADALCGIKAMKCKEYKIRKLFDEETVRHKLSKEDLSDRFKYPAYSSESANGGIIGYASVAEFICDENTPFHVTFGDHTRIFNIAKKSFSVLDNVKVLKPRINNEKAILFILATWAKQIPNIGYARHWKVAKDCELPLPTKDGKIDIEFMDRFISAIQKLSIKDVVLFTESKIEMTKNIVDGNK